MEINFFWLSLGPAATWERLCSSERPPLSHCKALSQSKFVLVRGRPIVLRVQLGLFWSGRVDDDEPRLRSRLLSTCHHTPDTLDTSKQQRTTTGKTLARLIFRSLEPHSSPGALHHHRSHVVSSATFVLVAPVDKNSGARQKWPSRGEEWKQIHLTTCAPFEWPSEQAGEDAKWPLGGDHFPR